MRRDCHWVASVVIVCLFTLGAARIVRGEEARDSAEARRQAAQKVREGNRLIAEGKHREALGAYEEAIGIAPDLPEAAYNRGVALYRLGRYAEAESAFQDAIRPGAVALEAASKYNAGRAAHAEALQRGEDFKAAADDLTRAIGFYHDGLSLHPDDGDAAKNKDLAERQLVYIQKMMEQPQSQPSDESQSGQSSTQPSQEPGEQQSKGEQSQPQDGSSAQQGQQEGEKDEAAEGAASDSPKEGDSGESEESSKQPREDVKGQDKKAQAESSDKEQDQRSEGAKAQDGQEGEGESGEGEQGLEEREEKLSEEAVRGMLQDVRDMERKRREAKRLERARTRGKVPVEMDW